MLDWIKELTLVHFQANVYAKSGSKRANNCQDAKCPCKPFFNAKYPSASLQKGDSGYSYVVNEPVSAGKLIVEYIGKVVNADTVKV